LTLPRPTSQLRPSGFFVTGTGTGVGKTSVACALLHALRAQGRSAIGMKPVASGCVEMAEGLVSEDAELLRAASSQRMPMRVINSYAFAPAIAPHIAADAVGVTIEIERILDAYCKLTQICDIVIVEGIGGFRVPLNAREDAADLAVRLKLPVVLVAGVQLGCLNHALLTVEAIAARGLQLAGWIANQIEPDMPAFAENVAALEQRIVEPCLGVIKFDSGLDLQAVGRSGTLNAFKILLKQMGVC
jgi:dethiobiotin synthetase